MKSLKLIYHICNEDKTPNYNKHNQPIKIQGRDQPSSIITIFLLVEFLFGTVSQKIIWQGFKLGKSYPAISLDMLWEYVHGLVLNNHTVGFRPVFRQLCPVLFSDSIIPKSRLRQPRPPLKWQNVLVQPKERGCVTQFASSFPTVFKQPRENCVQFSNKFGNRTSGFWTLTVSRNEV